VFKTATGNRADFAPRVLHDLRLLIGIQPSRRTNDEASRFERMLPNIDFGFLSEWGTEHGAGVHGRMDLFTDGDQRAACQEIVVLPACELADATCLAVDGAEARSVALSPDHALVMGRDDLSAPLDQPCQIALKS
jgi:hypothetical protein